MKNKPSRDNPLWLFWISGGGLILISIMAGINDPVENSTMAIISELTLNIGLTIVAVSVIDWIWRRVGGDPLMNAIQELKSTTALMSDLNSTGIKRVFLSREHTAERRQAFKEKMWHAKEVDLMGISLRSGWASNPEFQELVYQRAIERKTHFRFLVLDPNSPITAQRNFEEDPKPGSRIKGQVETTLGILTDIRNKLPEKTRAAIEIRVLSEVGIYCSVIRVDEAMLVTKYLLHLTGGHSELTEIEGKDTTHYKLYLEEFNCAWGRAAKWPN